MDWRKIRSLTETAGRGTHDEKLGETCSVLVPTFLVLIALAIAWRWEWLGGILFLALGAGYLLLAGGRVHWSAMLFIAGPLLLVGVLFLVSWWVGRAALEIGEFPCTL